MNKLKIFIGDNPELKNQVLDYLFALGYEWKGDKSYLETLRPDAIYAGSSDTISVNHCMTADQFEGYQSDHRTVTIEDLREMLVLQEYVPTEYLDTNDNYKYHKPNRPVFIGTGWIEIPKSAEAYLASADFKGFIKPDLCGALMLFEGGQWIYGTGIFKNKLDQALWVRTQPAELPDPFLKEYLTPDYKLMLANGPQDGWIEVPEGADTAVLWDEGEPYEVIAFYRENNKFYSPLERVWTSCTDWELVEIESSRKVVWQRDPHPEPETTNLEDSDTLLDVVYHYSASFNGARGTVSYDGVITFPGRITGIEDYRKVRAEIAKDGNVTPELVNVHSLTIVG